MNPTDSQPAIIRHVESGMVCCDPIWEAAYLRFETPEEEIQKFLSRLNAFGFGRLDKESRIVELFCGRGGGLVALSRLGFKNLHGLDLSESLLTQYRGPATLHLADARQLPFEDQSIDIAIVHGGLHHLPKLPDDLHAVLSEVRRVLVPQGAFYAVEPWRTPFLSFVHFVVSIRAIRRVYRKGDALAQMTEQEIETYEQWLRQPNAILDMLQQNFEVIQAKRSWGKLRFAGQPKA